MAKAFQGISAISIMTLAPTGHAVNRVFSRKLTAPKSCAHYFFELLLATSRLYGDYLLLRVGPRFPQSQARATARLGWVENPG